MNLAELRKQYQNKPLDEAHLATDPFIQFNLWFQQAAESGEQEPNAMTLATADRHGRPSARMVLLKGIEQDKFIFYTNYKSRKGNELSENPYAALVFWWPTLERQVRLEGLVNKVSAEISDRYFASRPIGSQVGAVISPQSQPIIDIEELHKKFAKLSSEYETIGHIKRPEYWGGYELKPHMVEFWQGRENRLHDRFRFDLQETGIWTFTRLAP